MATITKSIFGTTKQGDTTFSYKIQNNSGASVTITDFGATILSLCIPDRQGNLVDVVLGYDSLEEYEKEGGAYFGSVIGRYGNRIKDGRFVLNGITYELPRNQEPNHLHGGNTGFSHRLWKTEIKENSLIFSLHSPHMEEGYPANVDVTVTYQFSDDNVLSIDYYGKSDGDTILNLTNHSYFNLNGHNNGTVNEHWLKLYANQYLPTNSVAIPTGELAPVQGTPFDFTDFTQIGSRLHEDHQQLQYGNGYDHTYVLHNHGELLPFAEVYSEQSGITMCGKTTLPGVQFYSGNFLSNERTGKEHAVYQLRYGFALETQYYPDSINQPHFPSPILRAGTEYRSTTTYEFSIKK